MEKNAKKHKDPKDRKIKDLSDQVKFFQEKKIQLEHQVLSMSGMIEGFQNRLYFYRSAIEKGVPMKDMFLKEISYELQIDYEIAMYKHLTERIKKQGKLIGWIGSRAIKKIVAELNEAKVAAERTKNRPNPRKSNLTVKK